jgi:hypothetical protein
VHRLHPHPRGDEDRNNQQGLVKTGHKQPQLRGRGNQTVQFNESIAAVR